MKASLCLELQGNRPRNGLPLPAAKIRALGLYQHWCAEITGVGARGYARRFLTGRVDTHAESRAGIHAYYTLESGHLYEVQAPVQQGTCNHYFCTVTDDGTIAQLREDAARAWLERKQPVGYDPAISLQVRKDTLYVATPYHSAWPARARELGGTWQKGRKLWAFDPRNEARVRDLCFEVFGTDGGTVPTCTCTVRLNGLRRRGEDLWLLGRLLIGSGYAGVRLGEGVTVAHGRLAAEDAVLEVWDVPVALALRAIEQHPDAVSVGAYVAQEVHES